MGPKDERRKCRRFDVEWPIEVTARDRALARGRTSNISRGGAFFRSPEASESIEPGMTVDVRIDIPRGTLKTADAPTIVGRARVVRLEDNPGNCGVALHFAEEIDVLPDPVK